MELQTQGLVPSIIGKNAHIVGIAEAIPGVAFDVPLIRHKLLFSEVFQYEMKKTTVEVSLGPTTSASAKASTRLRPLRQSLRRTTSSRAERAFHCAGIAYTSDASIFLDKRMEKRHEQLRKRFKELRGKRVDWISHSIEEGCPYFTVRFTDKTALHLTVKPELRVEGLELCGWKTGDECVIRTYHRRH